MLRLIKSRPDLGLGFVALFATTGTLLCCALPIALVAIGLGSTVAAITSKLPVLVTLSSYHVWIFAGSAIVLVLATWSVLRARDCPVDPVLADRCQQANSLAKRILVVALLLWLTGLFFTYLLLPLRQLLSI